MIDNTAKRDITARATPAPEILFVIGSLDVGGTERHVAAVASSLSRRGWSVTVYTLADGGPLADELRRNGVDVIVPPVKRRPSVQGLGTRILLLAIVSIHLFFVMMRRSPAIVHCFLPAAYLVGVPLAALSGCKIRLMSRRSLNRYQQSRKLFGLLERWVHKLLTAALGNSRVVIQELKDEGIPSEKLALIYNGVDLAPYAASNAKAATREQLGLAPDAFVFVVVANLIPYKGHREFLKVLEIAKSRMPATWQALIVGRDDGIGHELMSIARSFDIEKQVHFLGLRRDIPDILKACDVGILCSHEEGFANSILEGMAAGLPMIVTDVGGNAEAVLHGETGFVVPLGDVDRLAESLVRLAGDESLRKTMGAAGRRRVEEKFPIGKCVSDYDELYRSLLMGKMPVDAAGLHVRK